MHSKLLTKYYFINTFDTNNLQKLDKETIIIYRNYTLTNINIHKLLKLKNFLRKKGNKFFIANNFKLALKYSSFFDDYNINHPFMSFIYIYSIFNNYCLIKIKDASKEDKLTVFGAPLTLLN